MPLNRIGWIANSHEPLQYLIQQVLVAHLPQCLSSGLLTTSIQNNFRPAQLNACLIGNAVVKQRLDTVISTPLEEAVHELIVAVLRPRRLLATQGGAKQLINSLHD